MPQNNNFFQNLQNGFSGFGDTPLGSFLKPIQTLLPAFLGFELGGPRAALQAGALFRDLGVTDKQNAISQEQRDFARQSIADTRDAITGSIDQFQPSFSFNGQTFGNPIPHVGQQTSPGLAQQLAADSGNNLIDINSLFTEGQTALDSFLASGITPESVQVGTGFIDASRAAQNAISAGARVTGSDLLQGVDLPTSDLSAVLAGRLGGISQAGRQREQQQTQQLGALAGQFGGLENLRRQGETLAFDQGSQRSLEASQAVSQTRQEELMAQEFVANQQQLAATEAAKINSALAQSLGVQEGALVDLETKTKQGDIQAVTDLANRISDLQAGAAGDQTAGLQFLLDQLNIQGNDQIRFDELLTRLAGLDASLGGNFGGSLSELLTFGALSDTGVQASSSGGGGSGITANVGL